VRAAAVSLNGVAAPVVRSDEPLTDSVRFTQVVCENLDEIGVGLGRRAWHAFLTVTFVEGSRQDW
jgi:hypothetical protein